MAWTVVQQTASGPINSNTGTVAVTLPANSTAGNLLVCFLESSTGNAPFTAPAGWIQAGSVGNGTGPPAALAAIWYFPANTGGINSASFTSGTANVRGHMVEYTDPFASSVYLTSSGTGTAGAVATCTATATTANPPNVLSVCTFHEHLAAAAVINWTDPTGFTLAASNTASAAEHMYAGYQLLTPAGTLSVTGTSDTASTSANGWAGVVATFSVAPVYTTPTAPGVTWQRRFRRKQVLPTPPVPTVITHVNRVSISGSGTTGATATIPTPTGIQPGDLIIVAANSNGTHATNGMSVQDSVNAAPYTTILETDLSSASSRWLQTFWYVTPVAIADGSTITLTGYASATNCCLSVDVFRGLGTWAISNPPVGNSPAAGIQITTPALAAAPNAGNLALSLVSVATTPSVQVNGPFLPGSASLNTTPSTAIGYVLAADGVSTYSTTWTFNTSQSVAGQTVAFRTPVSLPVVIAGAATVPVPPPPPPQFFPAVPPSGTVQGTASMSGSGTLTASPVFVGTATMSGSGTLSASPVFVGTASMSGSGTLSASPVFASTASMSGSGTLSASPTVGGPIPLVIQGLPVVIPPPPGPPQIVGQGPQVATASMTGVGTLSASPVFAGSATMTGSGTLSASPVFAETASMSGSGTLSASPVFAATATMSGSGTLSATPTVGGPIPLVVQGLPTVQRPVPPPSQVLFTTPPQPVTATMSGSGTLTASPVFVGAPTMTGSGTLSAAPVFVETATLSGSGTLTPLWTFGEISTMAGTGTLSAAPLFVSVASLSGSGTLTAAPVFTQTAVLSGNGTLTPLWLIRQVPVLSGVGTLTGASVQNVPTVLGSAKAGLATAPGAKTGHSAQPEAEAGVTSQSTPPKAGATTTSTAKAGQATVPRAGYG